VPQSDNAAPRRAQTQRLAITAVALSLVAAACTSSDSADPTEGGSTTASSATTIAPTTTVAPSTTTTTVPEVDFVSPSGIDGQDPDFNFSALVWQGYWLSRDQFGPFVMASGAGIPFEPPPEMMQAAMAMVAQNPDDPIRIPDNMVPLQAVFASADPALMNDPMAFDPMDFMGMRLDPSTFDETIRVRAQAETMLKESQWAHNFADAHFGAVGGEFGAQQRFVGQMTALLSIMQGQYAMENLMTESGLYADSDGTIDFTGNWVLLHTLADIGWLTSGETAGGRYMNPEVAPMFADATGGLLAALGDRTVEGVDEAAAAIRALAYVAATRPGLADDALDRLTEIADALSVAATPSEQGAAVAALVAAAAATGNTSYLTTADEVLSRLAAEFDPTTGVFSSTAIYTVDDVAWIIGGLNSAVQQGIISSRPEAARMLLAFYEATLGLAGMQLSAPPGKDGAMAGAFEQDLPHENYYHPITTPAPPMAGMLTVTAAEISLEDGGWVISDGRFDVAGTMHLANELNWLGPHLGSVPFPLLPGDSTSADAGADSSTDITVTAQNIAFDVSSIEASVGTTLTITFENTDENIPHNFHIQAGTLDVKTEITPGPDTQTLEVTFDQPGQFTFVCDVHPSMTGEVVVSSSQP
jgi:plastocyanin